MSILEYCKLVDFAVRSAEPRRLDLPNAACEEWFSDAGQAISAVIAATNANDDRALKLAGPLAEKYSSHVSRVERLLSTRHF